ncbi:hypothetical protein SprV_0501832200 [Sparganum proliferum]
MKKPLPVDQDGLQHHNQRNYAASQLRWNNIIDGETTDSDVLGRGRQKCLQPPIHDLRRRHRPARSSGGEQRPRPLASSAKKLSNLHISTPAGKHRDPFRSQSKFTNSAPSASRLQGWASILLGYDFDSRCRRTTDFSQADALSHLICNQHEPEEDTVIVTISSEDDVHRQLSDALRGISVTVADLRRAFQQDSVLRQAITYVQTC